MYHCPVHICLVGVADGFASVAEAAPPSRTASADSKRPIRPPWPKLTRYSWT